MSRKILLRLAKSKQLCDWSNFKHGGLSVMLKKVWRREAQVRGVVILRSMKSIHGQTASSQIYEETLKLSELNVQNFRADPLQRTSCAFQSASHVSSSMTSDLSWI